MRSYVHKTADAVQFPPSREEMSPAFKNVPCVRLFFPDLQLNNVTDEVSGSQSVCISGCIFSVVITGSRCRSSSRVSSFALKTSPA